MIDKKARLKVIESKNKLSAEEAFLLSRIDSEISFGDLLSLCPWPEDHGLKIIEDLLKKSCLEIVGQNASHTPPKDETKEVKEENSPKKTAKKNSAIKLGAEDRKEIQQRLQDDRLDNVHRAIDEKFRFELLVRFYGLKKGNAFEILNLKVTATDHDVKQSYVSLSRQFHPDRFFRKELGEYKAISQKVFSSIQKAYDEVKNLHDREAYLRKLKTESRTESKPERKEGSAPLKKKLDPALEKIGKAEFYYQAGLQAKKEENFVEAANHFLMASQLNPGKKVYERAHEDVQPFVMRERSFELLKMARENIGVGMSEDAMMYAEQAIRMNPDCHEAAVLMAKCILDLGVKERIDDSFQMLRRARVQLKEDAEVCLQLARIYQTQGEYEKATQECEEALRRDPEFTRAKKLLSKLK